MSTLNHGWTAATTSKAITPTSITRCVRRSINRNAASGALVIAAWMMITAATTAGTAGVGLCTPTATSARPRMYSASWCSQNGRLASC